MGTGESPSGSESVLERGPNRELRPTNVVPYGVTMRCLLAVLVALLALPAAAQDEFTLGLAEMDFAAGETDGPADDSILLPTDDISAEHAEVLAFQATLQNQSPEDRTEALWNSDYGRLYYELAAQQSMLGRQGLVNGGRMAGVGMATGTIGDGDPNGALGLVLGRQKWAEMNANQKVQAGVEAGIIAALLAFMISNAN